MGEKGLDFRCAHFGRVAHVVEVDVALDPMGVGFFRADGVVFEADGIAHTSAQLSTGPVEQFFVGCFHHVLRWYGLTFCEFHSIIGLSGDHTDSAIHKMAAAGLL